MFLISCILLISPYIFHDLPLSMYTLYTVLVMSHLSLLAMIDRAGFFRPSITLLIYFLDLTCLSAEYMN